MNNLETGICIGMLFSGKKAAKIEAKTINKNGTYSVNDESEQEKSLDGYNPITVDVQPRTTTKTITKNGSYAAADEPTEDEQEKYDGFSSVTVSVQPNLTTKTISANGTYKAADDGADGYSIVYVNVPQDWTDAKKLLDPPKDENGNIIPSESEDGKVTVSGGVIPVDPKNDPDTIKGITSGIGSLDDTPIYYTDTGGKHYSIKFYTVFHKEGSFPFQNYDCTSVNWDIIDLETGEVVSKAQGWNNYMFQSIGLHITSIEPVCGRTYVGGEGYVNATNFIVNIAGYDASGKRYTSSKQTGLIRVDWSNETWISTAEPTYTAA